ncbi:hypothetical protein T08_6930 [Trichinella sp. T8]|nr:hypothetical protein T08_6930 [Trichinella sp. T8]
MLSPMNNSGRSLKRASISHKTVWSSNRRTKGLLGVMNFHRIRSSLNLRCSFSQLLSLNRHWMNVSASLNYRKLSDCITRGRTLREINLRRPCRKLSVVCSIRNS